MTGDHEQVLAGTPWPWVPGMVLRPHFADAGANYSEASTQLPEQPGVESVEVETLNEGTATTYSHLVEGAREMILDGVLGDVERPGDLLGGGSLHDEVDDLSF